tara:strand:- start:205 stop:1125 length:921 start_codon:yes stop_codon:yes gene_type:complete
MATGLSLRNSGNLENMSKIIISNAIANVEPAGPTNQLVARYDIPAGSKQVNVPIWTRNDAAAITEGVDISVPQQVGATVETLTGEEHGILIFVSDRLQHQNNEDVLSHVGELQGNALGRLLDTDLVTLFRSFSKEIVDSTSSLVDGTIVHLAGAVSYLRTDNSSGTYGPAYGELNAVLHPEHIRRIAQDITGISAAGTATTAGTTYQGGISEDVLKNYHRGNMGIFGISIYEDGNIVKGAEVANSASGAVFQREALALAIEHEMTAEQERDASLRGTEVVMTGIWKEKEIVGKWGVEWHGNVTPIS